MPARSEKRHIDSLTGLRFYAAFGVFVSHMYHFEYFGLSGPLRMAMASLGAAGVSVFFVLSGFVLKINYPRLRQDLDTYAVSRWARIYPAFFVALLLAVPLEVGSPDKTELAVPFLTNLMLVHCFEATSCGAYNDVGWTLASEAMFYLAFPLLLLGAGRARRSLVWTGLVFAAVLANVAFNPSEFYASHQFPLNRFFEFMAGICGGTIFLSLRQPGAHRAYLSRALLGGIGLAAAGLFLGLLFLIPRFSQEGGTFLASGVLSLAIILTVAMLDAGGYRTRWLVSARVVLLGEISYSFYLVHNLLLRYFRNGLQVAFGTETGTWHVGLQLAAAAGLLVLALGASYVLYRTVEQPWRRRIKQAYHRRRVRNVTVPEAAENR